jgi:hypothetical protein
MTPRHVAFDDQQVLLCGTVQPDHFIDIPVSGFVFPL